ncbi:hypothetical protein BO70DRAFT_216743 [Aspergillus heteromorphus CBS 117.55]|uniref:Uncharacterized protein n=1 Tax=Aspergillus heteromorphus CBS 117.55 TaxID=1448321 RepID=A0A317US04_9EURO|nr:uncharacterized protein BO70DRAFT_216743 [Aspergillus heteromorphus CBS 117.55]PWY63888.1 hypothetical protein BO70DRAFT_216743 [Aspergillus heteromorphus CBS 117.55]
MAGMMDLSCRSRGPGYIFFGLPLEPVPTDNPGSWNPEGIPVGVDVGVDVDVVVLGWPARTMTLCQASDPDRTTVTHCNPRHNHHHHNHNHSSDSSIIHSLPLPLTLRMATTPPTPSEA